MYDKNIDESQLWYTEKRALYESFAFKVRDLIKEVLDSEKIPYHTIEARGKSIESFQKKVELGGNYEPKEMQDLAGVRIIAYVSSDVARISEIVKQLVTIDPKLSQDKADILGTDKIGYRSRHFICKLSQDRESLFENKKFKNMRVEIQVRTILQHTWAEIEHDRNYKFSGTLPHEIKRRLNLLAALLEIADNEFDQISGLIESYSQDVSNETKKGNLDIEINSTSLKQFLSEKFADVPGIEEILEREHTNYTSKLIAELKKMGVSTLAELEKLIRKDFTESYKKYRSEKANYQGLIRIIMISSNPEFYFDTVWDHSWNSLNTAFVKILTDLGIDVDALMQKYKLYIRLKD